MNYKGLYNNLLEVHGTTTKPTGRYTERHHIVPKSLGGTNLPANLTYVSARVHFICHRILCKLHPESDKLKFAFWAMCNQLHGRTYKVTSKVFEKAKQEFAIANSKVHKGKKMSKEHCEALSIKMQGNTIHSRGKESHLFGKGRTAEVKSKISKSKKDNPELNANFKGYYLTPEGKFASAPQAANSTSFSVDVIRRYCKNPGLLVTKAMVLRTTYFHLSQVGQPLSSLGWGFQPKVL